MRKQRGPTTTFDSTYLHYKCPYCESKPRSELADPKRNPNPFGFIPYCIGCQHPLELDWNVITDAQASFSTKPTPQ